MIVTNRPILPTTLNFEIDTNNNTKVKVKTDIKGVDTINKKDLITITAGEEDNIIHTINAHTMIGALQTITTSKETNKVQTHNTNLQLRQGILRSNRHSTCFQTIHLLSDEDEEESALKALQHTTACRYTTL